MSNTDQDEALQRRDDGQERYVLELVGLNEGGERPAIRVLALDRDGKALYGDNVDENGGFRLPHDVQRRAHRIVFGAPDAAEGIREQTAIRFRAAEFSRQLRYGRLALAERYWSGFFWRTRCVAGQVQVCRRRPWWFDAIAKAANQPPFADPRALRAPAQAADASAQRFRFGPSLDELIALPILRCSTVCRGVVEVYRRDCCCRPLHLDDWRLAELIGKLESLLRRRKPHVPGDRRPSPPPPPASLHAALRMPYFKGGASHALELNALRDVHALRALPQPQAAEYALERPYLLHLLCNCSAPVRIASGDLQPDGRFNICWTESRFALVGHCTSEYAYIVKQRIGSEVRTIYDGVSAHQWYDADEYAVLTSYDTAARVCGEGGVEGAFAQLELIGDTPSYELVSPAQDGWNSVQTPDAQSGLLFPREAGDADPDNLRLRNLGGILELTYLFGEGLRAQGAMYYRVGVYAADAAGNPIGNPAYFGQGGSQSLSWKRWVGADLVDDVLGPNMVGTTPYLYRIPFDEDALGKVVDWSGDVRYHATIDTTLTSPTDPESPAPGNHLVVLELFDEYGHRLRPQGTAAVDPSATEHERAFQYRTRRRPQPGSTVDAVPVHYAALTHLFCWDNRKPVVAIEQLLYGGNASSEDCQFLQAPGATPFAVSYRAYVPDARFQHAHSISWQRGLNGTFANGGAGALPTPLSPANVGQPPTGAQNSGSLSFAQMLTRVENGATTLLPRCAFSLTLTANAKTTDGTRFDWPQTSVTVAFALSVD